MASFRAGLPGEGGEEMTEVFFKLIPQILYEPIAVGALLGLFTALIFFWKKHREFYWIVTVSIVFMLGWRLAIRIISTRYASILIYPAIILSVYFCFKLEELCKLIPRFPDRLRRIVPWLFIIGLSIASLVKALHCNPYENYIRYNCSAAKKDAANFARPLALSDPREVRRYHYYSGVKTLGAAPLDFPGDTVNPAVVKSLLTRYSAQCDALYLFIVESSSNEPLTGTALGLPPENWKLLSWQYQNRRKKKQLRVYRCLPPPLNTVKKR